MTHIRAITGGQDPAEDEPPKTARSLRQQPPPAPGVRQIGVRLKMLHLPRQAVVRYGGIKDDGITKTLHDRDRSHIRNQIAIPEAASSFSYKYVVIAAIRNFRMQYSISDGAKN